MYDWWILIAGFLILIGLKLFLVRRSFYRKQQWYQHPREIAQSFHKERKADIIAKKYQDLTALDQLLYRNLTIFEIEWNATDKKNITALIDRIKNAAVIVYMIPTMHDEDVDMKLIKTKLQSLRGTFDSFKNLLDDIRKTPFEKNTWLTELEKMTIDTYIRDIFEVFGVKPAQTPYQELRDKPQPETKEKSQSSRKNKKNQ